jgi:hypothetical protein
MPKRFWPQPKRSENLPLRNFGCEISRGAPSYQSIYRRPQNVRADLLKINHTPLKSAPCVAEIGL